MAEMGALRVLMDWRAFDCIPEDRGISYAELAEKVDAEEPLLRMINPPTHVDLKLTT